MELRWNKRRGTSDNIRTVSGKKRHASSSTKAIYIACFALGLGGAGYFLYDRLRKKPTAVLPDGEPNNIIINNNLPAQRTAKTLVSQSRNDNFPLQRGSRGPRVIQLQQALANKVGADVMTKTYGGIDGQFGPLTAAALVKLGYPEKVTEEIFSQIISSSGSNSGLGDYAVQAKTLYNAAKAKDLDAVIAALRKIKSVVDYSLVNTHYKEIEFVGKTIVTDLLQYAFKDNILARDIVRQEFFRIGLKESDAGVWSLQGISLHRDLITLRETFVIDKLNNRIPVRKNTILGDQLQVANGITWVKGIDNTILQVPTQDVKYVN